MVVVDDEGPGTGEGETVGISATAISSSVAVNPHTITPGQVAEVTVIPEEESANSTLTVTVTGERDGLQKAKRTTVEVGEGLVVDGHGGDEDPMGTLAAEIRDKFIPWLAANHPELGVTKETEWTGTIVRPHILVVMYYLFFSEDWEMGVQWHVTIEPHNWARIYLRGRFSEVCPSYAFELSSWTAEDYEICAIDPPESVWR